MARRSLFRKNPEREAVRLWRIGHPGAVISNAAAPFQARIDQQWPALKAAVNSGDASIITAEQGKADALFAEIQGSGLSVDEKAYLADYFDDTVSGPKDALQGNYNNPAVTSLGRYHRVRFSKAEVEDFNREFPNSNLPNKAITFDYDEHGDLIDITGIDSARYDGQALSVLSRDGNELLAQRTGDDSMRRNQNPIRYTIEGIIPDEMLIAQQEFTQRSATVIGVGVLAIAAVWLWDRFNRNP